MKILSYEFMQNAIIACILGGGSCAMIGVFVLMMKIPFIGVTMSHAAFAGAIFGVLFHLNPLITATLFCFIAATLIGPVADKADFDPELAIGIIFSLMLGFAFLGMGLIEGPKSEALKWIWGNILMISRRDVFLMAVVAFIAFLLLFLFFKEVQAVLFNRIVAASVGIPERAIYYVLLFLSGLIVTLNLNTIGGLLIFSLIINPPSAAYQLTYSLKNMFLLSALFGVLSSLFGLIISYLFNAPSGAVIIIVSSAIFGLALVFSPKRKAKKIERGKNEPSSIF